MCKHKSGGMSKPTGAATEQSGLSERTTASYSSHNCPQEANGASSSQIHNPLTTNSDNLYSSQMRNSAISQVPTSTEALHCSGTDSTHKFLPNDQNPKYISRQKFQNLPFLPNILQETHEGDYSDSQDSDDEDTEHSPMLLNQGNSVYCTPGDTWNPNIMPDVEFDKDSMEPKYFNECDTSLGMGAESRAGQGNNNACCDKFPIYKSFQVPGNFQASAPYIPPPYSSAIGFASFLNSPINKYSAAHQSQVHEYENQPKIRKKWLFVNQKCKSADSEPDSFSRHISSICQRGPSFEYNYDEVKMPNVHQSQLASNRHRYMKPAYSTGTDAEAGPSGLQRPSSINWEMGGKDNKDEEFRCRSYSLTPTVNFAVFESESSSEAEEAPEPVLPEPIVLPVKEDLCAKSIDEPYDIPMLSLGKVIPISPSAAQLSIASSYGDNGSPICKICHMTAKENDPLISPCRCSGTMQYIHCVCLMRWLEVCNKRSRKPASCELCQYQYHWHRKFKIRHWQLPQCSRRDKILHVMFFLSVLLMVACASVTVLCFKQDKGTKVDPDRTELTQSEIVTLICGVLFFLAFFVAMYVEVKSHYTLYQLLVKFVRINQQWYIDEYEKKESAPVAV